MHEMSLVEGLVSLVEEEAARQSFKGVKTVVLEVGAASHVSAEALSFCFEAIARGTIVEGARLEIKLVPASGWCFTCSQTVPVDGRFSPCPKCGGHQVQMTGGDELRVKELEVF